MKKGVSFSEHVVKVNVSDCAEFTAGYHVIVILSIYNPDLIFPDLSSCLSGLIKTAQ